LSGIKGEEINSGSSAERKICFSAQLIKKKRLEIQKNIKKMIVSQRIKEG